MDSFGLVLRVERTGDSALGRDVVDSLSTDAGTSRRHGVSIQDVLVETNRAQNGGILRRIDGRHRDTSWNHGSWNGVDTGRSGAWNANSTSRYSSWDSNRDNGSSGHLHGRDGRGSEACSRGRERRGSSGGEWSRGHPGRSERGLRGKRRSLSVEGNSCDSNRGNRNSCDSNRGNRNSCDSNNGGFAIDGSKANNGGFAINGIGLNGRYGSHANSAIHTNCATIDVLFGNDRRVVLVASDFVDRSLRFRNNFFVCHWRVDGLRNTNGHVVRLGNRDSVVHWHVDWLGNTNDLRLRHADLDRMRDLNRHRLNDLPSNGHRHSDWDLLRNGTRHPDGHCDGDVPRDRVWGGNSNSDLLHSGDWDLNSHLLHLDNLVRDRDRLSDHSLFRVCNRDGNADRNLVWASNRDGHGDIDRHAIGNRHTHRHRHGNARSLLVNPGHDLGHAHRDDNLVWDRNSDCNGNLNGDRLGHVDGLSHGHLHGNRDLHRYVHVGHHR